MRRDAGVFQDVSGMMGDQNKRSRLAEETDQIRRRSRVVRHHAEDLAEQLAHIQREVQRTLDELHHEIPRRGES